MRTSDPSFSETLIPRLPTGAEKHCLFPANLAIPDKTRQDKTRQKKKCFRNNVS